MARFDKGLVFTYGEGEATKWDRGGGFGEQVLPLQKKGGGAEKVLARLKGETQKV